MNDEYEQSTMSRSSPQHPQSNEQPEPKTDVNNLETTSRNSKGVIGLSTSVATGWLKIIGIYIAALTTFVLALTKLAEPVKQLFPDVPNWLWLTVASLPLLAAILTHGLPAWVRQYRLKKLREWGIKGSIKELGYFRITPYENNEEDRKRYTRADNAHIQCFNWLHQSEEKFLYLTGVSGAGKSSLLNAYALPMLEEVTPSVHHVVVRSFHDPLEELQTAIIHPGVIWEKPPSKLPKDMLGLLRRVSERLGKNRLLIIFDQFEEFLIIHDRDPQRLDALKKLLTKLQSSPIEGIQVLLVLRSDYLGMLQELEISNLLPVMRQRVNWMEVSPFLERHARDFLIDSGLKIGKKLMDDIFLQIREIEDTVGLVRPITLNMIGLILDRKALTEKRSYIRRRGSSGLILDYLQESIQRPDVRDYAPPILHQMITKSGTKKPKPVAELAAETNLSESAVTGCLLILANQGLVRRIDIKTSVWEVSHDFIARLLDHVLNTWQASAMQKIRPVVLPATLIIWGAVFLLLPFITNPLQELKMSDISAELEYYLPYNIAPPNKLFENGYELEIAGYHSENMESVDMSYNWGSFRGDKPQYLFTSNVEVTNITVEATVDDANYTTVSTFSQFKGDLGDLRNPTEWETIFLEARLIGYSQNSWWEELRHVVDEYDIYNYEEGFYELYGVTHEQLYEWAGDDYSVSPLPVRVELRVYVNGILRARQNGWVAAVWEHDEDVRGKYVIKFPTTRTQNMNTSIQQGSIPGE